MESSMPATPGRHSVGASQQGSPAFTTPGNRGEGRRGSRRLSLYESLNAQTPSALNKLAATPTEAQKLVADGQGGVKPSLGGRSPMLRKNSTVVFEITEEDRKALTPQTLERAPSKLDVSGVSSLQMSESAPARKSSSPARTRKSVGRGRISMGPGTRRSMGAGMRKSMGAGMRKSMGSPGTSPWANQDQAGGDMAEEGFGDDEDDSDGDGDDFEAFGGDAAEALGGGRMSFSEPSLSGANAGDSPNTKKLAAQALKVSKWAGVGLKIAQRPADARPSLGPDVKRGLTTLQEVRDAVMSHELSTAPLSDSESEAAGCLWKHGVMPKRLMADFSTIARERTRHCLEPQARAVCHMRRQTTEGTSGWQDCSIILSQGVLYGGQPYELKETMEPVVGNFRCLGTMKNALVSCTCEPKSDQETPVGYYLDVYLPHSECRIHIAPLDLLDLLRMGGALMQAYQVESGLTEVPEPMVKDEEISREEWCKRARQWSQWAQEEEDEWDEDEDSLEVGLAAVDEEDEDDLGKSRLDDDAEEDWEQGGKISGISGISGSSAKGSSCASELGAATSGGEEQPKQGDRSMDEEEHPVDEKGHPIEEGGVPKDDGEQATALSEQHANEDVVKEQFNADGETALDGKEEPSEEGDVPKEALPVKEHRLSEGDMPRHESEPALEETETAHHEEGANEPIKDEVEQQSGEAEPTEDEKVQPLDEGDAPKNGEQQQLEEIAEQPVKEGVGHEEKKEEAEPKGEGEPPVDGKELPAPSTSRRLGKELQNGEEKAEQDAAMQGQEKVEQDKATQQPAQEGLKAYQSSPGAGQAATSADDPRRHSEQIMRRSSPALPARTPQHKRPPSPK
ncbi:unnamed protein product, partial [Chrysoparadoxa australica]